MSTESVAGASEENRQDPTRLTYSQAENRMKDLRDECERIAAKESRTDEDDRLFASYVHEIGLLDEHARNLQRQASLAEVRSIVDDPSRSGGKVASGVQTNERSRDSYDRDAILEPDSIEDARFRNPWDLSEVRTFDRNPGEIGQEMRSRALSAIEKMPATSDRVRAAATSIMEGHDDKQGTIARLCLATSSPEYLRAWAKLAVGKGHMLEQREQEAVNRAMSLTDSQGGYLVPFQLDPTVILTSDGSRNDIRQVARQVVATGDVWNGVSAGSVSWRWAAEASEATDGAPSFAQPKVQLHKADGFVPISIEAMEDEQNVTQEVARLLAQGKDELEAAAFISGSGAGQPTGIVTALDGGSSEINTASAATFAAEDVYTMDNGLPARYRPSASWLGNRGIYNLVRQFDTQGGAQMWERIGADVPAQLLGRPVYEAEAMANSVATGNDILVYGDFSNYVIADRIGMTVEFIPHLMGSNNRPQGQRGWYAYYRVGADVVNAGGLRMLNVS
ncbi:phage major capsid protein, HK97 family [Actinopolyspora xinjiangensis]|uniref:Phage major capsid protein, HK97 family n=1 Tax=Actinopolyspora xinjiangensis TaxID=405564 RepID=A0A1H0U4R4_9ACTN|nr:phage major capsid protein [Actinopolyspora xinjiangensis]SDP60816.1 phage major capsid protein, HK97 family [Actinopolyspora xinjiangensis]